jgi:vacuolar protein sorting-associated protein 35
VQDGPDTPSEQEQIYTIDVKEEFAEEQHLVCRALQAIDTPDLATLSKIYSGVRKQLGRGGAERMRFTLKAMTSMYTRLALRCAKATANLQEGEEDHGVNLTKIFTFIHSGDGVGMLELLCDTAPLEAFPYYLHAAGVADACALGEQCYDLMAAAFMVYEQRGAADTKLQIQCLTQMISTVAATRNLPEETYMQLAAKLCQYSSGLLLKQDNSRLALLCSHLFWKKALSEDSRRMTLDCLQRALKQADKSPASTQYELFTEALNRYSYYFAAAMPLVEPKHVNSLIDMVRTAKDAAAGAAAPTAAAASTMMPAAQVATYAQNTTRYLTNRKRDGGDERWDEINL